MIAPVKRAMASLWPRLRLRTIIFGTLLFVAALPGFSALFLRVYENALVRRTEAELVAEGATLAATAALLWPQSAPARTTPLATPLATLPSALDVGRSAYPAPTWGNGRTRYEPRPTAVDLSAAAILPERPRAAPTHTPPQADAQGVATRLAPVLAETTQATLASVRLLDARGIVLNGPDRGRSLAGVDEVVTALHGAPATTLRRNSRHSATPLDWLSRASGIRLHHARPVRVQGRVVGVILLSRTPPPLLSGMVEDGGKILFGVAAIFTALLFITALLARAIVRPIETLSRATRAVAHGRAAIPADPSLKVVEIETLYADFRAMAAGIAERSRYLRDFAASLSHEFKTPLTGITGAIELLEDHGATMEPAERQRFLTNMRGDADRLSRLVRRLMDLARADMAMPDGRARCDGAATLASIADGYRGGGFDVQLSLGTATPPAPILLAIEGETLAAIATVLVENARQAGARHLVISAEILRIAGEGRGHQAMHFTDDGDGIAPADAARIFDTFFTSRREQGGTGLGLAIARSLAEANGGTLALANTGGTSTRANGPASGATFTLTLPLA
jgi:signal transduction histidine kinase